MSGSTRMDAPIPEWARATAEDGTHFWISPLDKPAARDLVVANHYSHSWNTPFGTYCFGVFDHDGLAGALVFGNLMNPSSYATLADLPPEAVTELNRMWIHDRLGPNTETACLSRAMRWLRHNSPVQLVQTFADGRLGCGTVYKAANFGYYGHDETLFFDEPATGTVHHGTPFSNTANARGMVARNMLLVTGALEPFTVKTYRYLYPLTKYARRRIILNEQPYPVYDKGTTPRPDWRPPATQIARCAVMAQAMGYRTEAAAFDAYLAANYPPPVVADALAIALGNEWVADILVEAEAQPDLLGLLDSPERVA